jgi:hypothetical protein
VIAQEVGCVSAEERVLQEFWEDRENVSRVLECLREKPANELKILTGKLENEKIYFHGLANEKDTDDQAVRMQ